MSNVREGEVLEKEMPMTTGDAAALEAVIGSEIDKQISTAKRFPRSVTKFHAEAIGLVSLNEEVADECIYALPRDDKTIEGPSARFAEVVLYSWGNCRAGARVVGEDDQFVTAQGFHWDLEKNTAIGYEVKRRITNRSGRRYSSDMIGVTANAACSIALRNAILKGIPKALWVPVYEKARQTIMGDFQTLGARRGVVLGNFQKFGVTPERVCAKLGVAGPGDITLEQIVVLRGLLNALKEGDTSVEDQFPREQARGAGAAFERAVGGAGGQPAETATRAAEAGQGEAAGAGVGVSSQPEAQAPKGAKEPGTPKLRKAYLDKMAKSGDRDVLASLYDETRLYAWAEGEQAELTTAYQKRLGELGAG